MSNVLLVLNSEIYTISAKNSKKDQNTGILEIATINVNVTSNKTGNLPKQLKLCLGAKLMLTINVDTADKLINGSCGQIEHVRGMYPNLLDQGTI